MAMTRGIEFVCTAEPPSQFSWPEAILYYSLSPFLTLPDKKGQLLTAAEERNKAGRQAPRRSHCRRYSPAQEAAAAAR